jgi:hypothetical protein
MEVSSDSKRDSQIDTWRRTLLASCGAFLYSLVILVCYFLGYVLMEGTELVLLFSCFWSGHIATVVFFYLRTRQNKQLFTIR